METKTKTRSLKVITVGGVAGGASCAARLGELPRDREMLVTCQSGQRACYAPRILLQHGFTARNIFGAFLSRAIRAEGFADTSMPTTT